MLYVGDCENFSVRWYPVLVGAADDSATAVIYSCGSNQDASGDDPYDATFSATGLCWSIENLTLDGDSSTNTEAIYGADSEWIYADFGSITDDTPRLIVKCGQ
jgi:hypothetical protein